MTGGADGFFDRVCARHGIGGVARPVAEWCEDATAMPHGGYVEARLLGGDVIRAMRTAGDSVYDIRTGDRVDVEMIAAWRRA